MARRGTEQPQDVGRVDATVEALMGDMEAAWLLRVSAATSQKRLATTAVALRDVYREMLKYAETSPVLSTGSVSRGIDAILSRQYFSSLNLQIESTSTTAETGIRSWPIPCHTSGVAVELLHGVLRYGLCRIYCFLRRDKGGVTGPLISWEVLGHTVLHAINTSLQLRLVTPRSHLGLLYLEPGFITAMEVFCRTGTAEIYPQGRRPTHGSSAIQLASTLSGSLFLIGWVLRQPLSRRSLVVARSVCVSYLGTILKLQRLVVLLIEARLGRSSNTPPISQRTSNMLHDGMHTLVTIRSLITASTASTASTFASDDRNNARMELRINRALVEGHGILKHVRPPIGTDLDPKIGRLATRNLHHWVARTDELMHAGCDAFLECHNLRCVNLTAITEAAMPTKLCGGCRRVRYCSRGCQGEDRGIHRLTCPDRA